MRVVKPGPGRKSFSVNFDAHNAVGPISHYVGAYVVGYFIFCF